MGAVFRKATISLAAVAALIALAAGLMWWSIHTAWFANLVRDRIVSTLHETTGGRVEISAFHFNPDKMRAEISRLVIHGSEPHGLPPLLTVDSVKVGVTILSVWRRDVDIDTVIINRPQVFLLVNPDGTMNLPVPQHHSDKSAIEELLNLKIKHLEVNQGIFQANNRRIPLQFVSQGTAVTLNYDRSGPSYGVSLQTDNVNFAFLGTMLQPIQLAAKAHLFKDHADIESFKVVTGKASSTIELAGKIVHFANLSADMHLEASLSIDELARIPDINEQLRNGRANVSGNAHFDASTSKFNFNGKARASGVDLILPGFILRGMAADADMAANNDGMLLHHAHGFARGAHLSGEASIKGYNFLDVHADVSQVDLKQVGSYLTNQPFPWSGTAHGNGHASAHLLERDPDFIIGAKVDIDSGQTGIPTSGNVDVTYYNRTDKVEFGNSELHLPHSTANFKGTLDSDLLLGATTSDLTDLQPIIPILQARIDPADLPKIDQGGSASFNGTLQNLARQPIVNGAVELKKFEFRKYDWDSLSCQFNLSAAALSIARFQLQQTGASLVGSASAQLTNWEFMDASPVQLNARFTNLNIVKTATMLGRATLPGIQGVASGSIAFQGTVNKPHGNGTVQIANLDAYGEQLNRVQMDAALNGDQIQIRNGRVQSGPALLNFSGGYLHKPNDWSTGDLNIKADTNGFPLSGLATIRKFVPALDARADVHLEALGRIRANGFEPLKLDGRANFSHVMLNSRELGSASLQAVTQGTAIDFKYTGDLRETKFHGDAEAHLSPGTPVRGKLQLQRISLADLKSVASDEKLALPVDGFLDGNVDFDGPLEEPLRMHARATIDNLQISSAPIAKGGVPDIVLKNNEPLLLDLAGGVLNITRFEIDGRETSVKITGTAPLFNDAPVDVKAVGKADLALFELFDPSVKSSGSSELATNITGPISAPNFTGALQVRNGSFFPADLPNGLSDVNGTVVLSRNRATIQKMTARSGGGDLSIGGSLSFVPGTPLVYHLEANARNVRVRYANSISVTANSDLRLSGTSASSLLSGTLTVTRVVFTPNTDAGNLLAAATSTVSSPADEGDFLAGLHLDIIIESAPNLQVSTNLSRDVEAELQLRLRGTPSHPILLGNITANQGDLKIFGTRFSLNRGEVSFVNTVRIEPVLDLDLETQARGVTVDITVSGTPSKLNFNYRSDPPLQPRDIIALLTVGRTPDVGTSSNVQSGSDVGALTSGVNSVLGQAISPVSNRLSKLFGIANIRIDPFVQGITNTPQARLSVEQQISRDVTITYVTNLSQTSEQIFRFEWALNRQFSIVALRDDNGEFGIDFQYKKRFK